MNGRSLNDQDIDLLKFNYKNLHESVWECHKASWIVTSIFVPIIFAMQGYFIKYCFSALNTPTTGISIVQVLMGAFVIQSLVVVWWLIMRIFSRYNEVRMKRLKDIENIFNSNNADSIKQYKLHYTLYYMLNLGKLVGRIKHRKFLFSWDDVPGNDSERLKRYLKYDHDIGWEKSAKIHKSDDGETIFFAVAGKIPAEIIIDKKREKATLEISDGITQSLYVKKEKGKVNIYKRLTNCKIKIGFDLVCDLIVVGTVATNLFLIVYSAYLM